MTSLAEAMGLTPAALESRLSVLDLSQDDRRKLRDLSPPVLAAADDFIDRLYVRLTGFAPTAAWFTREGTLERLKRQQRAYLDELFTAPIDGAYVERRLHIGTVHHRVRLTPRWYVLTCAHFILGHLDPVLDHGGEDAPERLISLIKTLLFDAALTLDAYGMALEDALRNDTATAGGTHSGIPGAAAPAEAGPADPASAAGTLARIPSVSEGCQERCQFLDLDEANCEIIRTLPAILQRALPNALEEFYATFSAWPQTAALLPESTVRRLMAQVSAYWSELAQGRFDRPYAASRTRIGVIHEQLGVSAQHYLIGFARQLASFLRAIFRHHDRPRAAAAALLRAAFFDISCVMDAYLDARAAAVLRSEGYASQLLSCLTVGVAVLDPQLRLRSANPALLRLLGTDASIVRHLHLRDLLPAPEVVALAERAQKEPDRRETLHTRFGGRLLRLSTMRLTTQPHADSASQLALLIDDITDLVSIPPQVDQVETHLRETINAIDAVLWEADAEDWTFSLVSSPVVELTGLREFHFLGRAHAWPESIPSPDRERFLKRCNALLDGQRCEILHRLQHADGTQPWVRTHVVRTRKGTARAVLHGVSINVTASIDAERRRLEAITRLSGSVAHEFNSVLTVVSGTMSLLAESAAPELRTDLETARTAVTRGALLTRHLQSFAHARPLRPRPVLLSDLIQSSKPEVSRLLGTDIELVTHDAGELWWCQIDPAQFEEALFNVVRNARDAMPTGGRLTLQTRNLRAESLAPTHEHASEGDHVELSVSDSGGGMSEDTRRKSVEPFFTTKDQALGLGLSVVHGFVRQSKGHLIIESHLGSGTTVRMRFPRHHALPPPLAASPPPATPHRTILVVDDDATVAHVFRRLLERRGYGVRVAAHTDQARAGLAESLPDLVITDVVFGSAPLGIAFAREIRTRYPGLPVIITSGYTKESLDLGPEDCFLPKPFGVEDLYHLLDSCLQKTPQAAIASKVAHN